MLIDLFEKKWPEIRKIGREAAREANALGLKTDWQKEQETEAARPEKQVVKLKA